jgi:hypothetical protein
MLNVIPLRVTSCSFVCQSSMCFLYGDTSPSSQRRQNLTEVVFIEARIHKTLRQLRAGQVIARRSR